MTINYHLVHARNATASALPIFISFFCIPITIFSSNAYEFEWDTFILLPFMAIAIIGWIILFITSICGQLSNRYIKFMLTIGVFILLSDALFTTQWGPIDGNSQIKISKTETIGQACLATAIVLISYFTPILSSKNYGFLLTCAITATSCIQLASIHAPHAESIINSDKSIHQVKFKGNIYEIVFDGFSGLEFSKTIRNLNIKNEFSGFTFFENSYANETGTDASLPSFFQGVGFRGGNYYEYQEKARYGGFRSRLRENGFNISLYIPDKARYWSFPSAQHVVTSMELAGINPRIQHLQTLLLVSAVRLTPIPIKRWTRRKLEAIFVNSSYHKYKSASIPLIDQFIKDEKNRNRAGNYIYMHLILPHPPFLLNSQCAVTQEVATSYDDQTKCATLQMVRILQAIAEAKNFDNSLILIHSDHGFDSVNSDPGPFAKEVPIDVENAITTNETFDTPGVMRRLRPLILSKRPAQSGEIQTSPKQVQLLDISATIYSELNMSNSSDGDSIFCDSCPYKPVEIYFGASRLSSIPHGKKFLFLKSSYSQSTGWGPVTKVEAIR
ncbi:hypothetical protein [Ideonella azotifigens]|nr:hypothetical protein [Ideonella azotifigens]